MILVTVGMHSQPFDRLVRAADQLASLIAEPVVIQRGVSRHTPAAAHSFDFTDGPGMARWIARASVVVAHGGAGSILEALQAGKALVLVPRLQRFGEHRDDHQRELVAALASQGRAVAVIDPSGPSLRHAIQRASHLATNPGQPGTLPMALHTWLADCAQAAHAPRPAPSWPNPPRG